MTSQRPPTVFISCTAGLRRIAEKVVAVLHKRGMCVFFDCNYPPQWASVGQQRLKEYLKDCDAAICLFGPAHGGEPNDAVSGLKDPRTEGKHFSFAQIEFLVARDLQRPVFPFIIGLDSDIVEPFEAERRTLVERQEQFIENFVTCDLRYYHENSSEKLLELVEKMDIPLTDLAGKPLNLMDDCRSTLFNGRDEPEKPAPYLDENVQFTVFRPPIVEPMKWHTMLAFAHLSEKPPGSDEDPLAEVERQARATLSDAFDDFRQLVEDSRLAIPRDGEITFVPEVEDVAFNPPRITFLWAEPVHRAEFRLRAGATTTGRTLRGRLTVFLGHLILADIALALRVEVQPASRKAKPVASSARPYRKIFASYSHRDSTVVAQFERYAMSLGDRYLRDTVHLRAGEIWNDQLRELILDADVFQLFWSSNSMRSPYCRDEWEFALGLGRDKFVRPTYWEDPMPESPADGLPGAKLSRVHFQRIDFGASCAEPADQKPPSMSVPPPCPCPSTAGLVLKKRDINTGSGTKDGATDYRTEFTRMAEELKRKQAAGQAGIVLDPIGADEGLIDEDILSDPVERVLREARLLIKDEQYREAVALLDKFLAEHGPNHEAIYLKAYATASGADDQETADRLALECLLPLHRARTDDDLSTRAESLREAIRGRRFAGILINFIIMMEPEAIDGGVKMLRGEIALDPGNGFYHFMLAGGLMNANRPADALAAAEEGMRQCERSDERGRLENICGDARSRLAEQALQPALTFYRQGKFTQAHGALVEVPPVHRRIRICITFEAYLRELAAGSTGFWIGLFNKANLHFSHDRAAFLPLCLALALALSEARS